MSEPRKLLARGKAGPSGPSGTATQAQIVAGITNKRSFRESIGAPAYFYAADYGAVGDGTTDDSVALRAMVAAALATSSTEIIFELGTDKTYLLGSNTTQTVGGTSQAAGLYLANATRRQLIEFRGQGSALLKSGSDQAHHVLACTNFNVLRFRGVHLKRTHTADLAQGGAGNDAYAQGVVVYPYDDQPADLIHFTGCKFTDCHRGYSIYRSSGVESATFALGAIRGKLREVLAEDCEWVYPRGSNHNGSASGGQGEYVTCWAALATTRRCKFDGAVGGDVSTVPGSELPKDGFVFGSPLRRVVRDCETNHFSFEGMTSTVDRVLVYDAVAHVMPAVGATLAVTSALLAIQVAEGDFILRDSLGWFEITDITGSVVTAENAGARHGITNAVPGTVAVGGFWKDDFDAKDCVLDVQDCRFPETKVLTSNPTSSYAAYPCIAGYGMRVIAINNDGPDCLWGVYASCEYHERFATFGDRSQAARNRCRLVDHHEFPCRDNVIGIFFKDIRDPSVEENRIDAATGYDFTGIHVSGIRGTAMIKANAVAGARDYQEGVKDDSTGYIVSNATAAGGALLGSALLLENIDINCVAATDLTNNTSSPAGLVRNHVSIKTSDPDTLEFIRISGASDLAGLDGWVKGVKALGLWDLMVCWPMRAGQNATGATVHSLGGLGLFPATQDGAVPSVTAAGRVIASTGQTLCAEDLVPTGADGALLCVVDFAATGSEGRVISYDQPATSNGLGIDKFPATQFRRLGSSFDGGWGTQSTNPTLLAVGGGTSTFKAQDATFTAAAALALTSGGYELSPIGLRFQPVALGSYAFSAYLAGPLSSANYAALRTLYKATLGAGLGLP